MFNNQRLTLLLLSIVIGLVSSLDVINFNVYTNDVGTETYGHFKLAPIQLATNFSMKEINSTHSTFNFNSLEPYKFDVMGKAVTLKTPNSETTNGQVMIPSLNTTLDFMKMKSDRNLTSARFTFKIPEVMTGIYLLEIDESNECIPYQMRSNVTTIPPEMMVYHANVQNVCEKGVKRGELFKSSMTSALWPWLNHSFEQLSNENSTHEMEKWNLHSDLIGRFMGSANWNNGTTLTSNQNINFNSDFVETLKSFLYSLRLDQLLGASGSVGVPE